MTPREIAQSKNIQAVRPVPGIDYGRRLADEINRLRIEAPRQLEQMLLCAQAGAAMSYYAILLSEAAKILPAGVSVDDVSDGTTIAALFDAVNDTPLGRPLSQFSAQQAAALQRKETNGR